MPTIRELVATLAHREGVEAAIVLGRDGLLIDGRSAAGGVPLAERLSALVPSVVSAAETLGRDAGTGPLATAVLEYDHGYALVCTLTPEAILLVLVRPDGGANVGALLFDIRRHRSSIAAIV